MDFFPMLFLQLGKALVPAGDDALETVRMMGYPIIVSVLVRTRVVNDIRRYHTIDFQYLVEVLGVEPKSYKGEARSLSHG